MVDQRICSVEGCGRKHMGLGFCKPHYRSFKRYGDPLRAVPMKGESHYAWLHENPTYQAIHGRLRKQRGKATGYACISCSSPAHSWAYDRQDPDQRTEVQSNGTTVTFSADLDRYQPMCDSCHNKLDQRYKVWRDVCERGHPRAINRRVNGNGTRCAACHAEDERERYRQSVGGLTRPIGEPVDCDQCGRGPFVGALGLAQHRRYCGT